MKKSDFFYFLNFPSQFVFESSEITNCSMLIFELENTSDATFKNANFHNNTLATSVLGGFTTDSKAITFYNCNFLNNTPERAGNPAFRRGRARNRPHARESSRTDGSVRDLIFGSQQHHLGECGRRGLV